MTEPGAAQDEAAKIKWRAVVRSKHKFLKFSPPFASCKCGRWHFSAPSDYGAIAQRDILLDAFLAHHKFMSEEKKRLRNAESTI